VTDNTMEKPQLQIKPWKLGKPFVYRCSVCGQEFIVPEDRCPGEGMAELWAAFYEHILESHGAGAAWSSTSPRRNG
jgi:rubrerythrin